MDCNYFPINNLPLWNNSNDNIITLDSVTDWSGVYNGFGYRVRQQASNGKITSGYVKATYVISRITENEPGYMLQALGFGAKSFGIAIKKNGVHNLLMADTTDSVYREFTSIKIENNSVLTMQGVDREAFIPLDEPLTSSAYVYVANFERQN